MTLITPRSHTVMALNGKSKLHPIQKTVNANEVRRSQWKADNYEACLEANWGREFSAITRYDSAELRDTALEMLHVQEFYTLRDELAALTLDQQPIRL